MDTLFRRTPGIVFDMSQILLMKLNEEEKWIGREVNPETKEEDLAYIKHWLGKFDAPSQDLKVFFHLGKGEDESFFEQVLVRIVRKAGLGVSGQDFLNYLSNVARVRRELTAFYLGEEVDCESAEKVAEALQKAEHLDANFRFEFLAFYVNAEVYVHQLKITFYKLFKQLESMYEEETRRLLSWEDNLEAMDVAASLGLVQDGKRGTEPLPGFFILSPTLVCRRHYLLIQGDPTWFILGREYDGQFLMKEEPALDLPSIGMALCDEQRVKIFETILTTPKINMTEISHEILLPPGPVVYNLEWMKKANLVTAGRRIKRGGRLCVDLELLEKVIDEMESWIRGDALEEALGEGSMEDGD